MLKIIKLTTLLLIAGLVPTHASAAMTPQDAKDFARYKFSQVVGVAWKRFAESVPIVGTAAEKAAFARMKLRYAGDDFGLPSVATACTRDGPCDVKMNAGFVTFSSIFVFSSAASVHLHSPPGQAITCFDANIDSYSRHIAQGDAKNSYVDIVRCLGDTSETPEHLINNQDYEDLSDIALLESLYFAFAHEMAHIKNGDMDHPGRDSRATEIAADRDGADFLTRAGIDSFFGIGATGVFRIAEPISPSAASNGYPSARCRMINAAASARAAMRGIDVSKIAYDTPDERRLRSQLMAWKRKEVDEFLSRNSGFVHNGQCDGYILAR